MNQSLIRSALTKHLLDMNLGVPLSFVGQPFEPPAGALWCSVNVMFSRADVVTIGPTGEDSRKGYMSIIIRAPVGVGDGEIYAVADNISEKSQAGTALIYDEQAVTITGCGMGVVYEESGFINGQVMVYFRARTHRNLI